MPKRWFVVVFVGMVAEAAQAEAGPACGSPRECAARCDAGISTACDELRVQMELGCSKGHAEACYALSYVYDGGHLGVAVSDEKSSAFARKACELGHGGGCNEWAFDLAYGEGVPRDDARAVMVWKRGCELNHPMSCGTYGARLLLGRGIARDAALAGPALDKACKLTDPLGCYHLGNWHTEQRRDPQALAAWRSSCSLGVAEACEALTARGEAAPVKLDAAQVFAEHVRQCDAGVPMGCARVADDYRLGRGVPADLEKAKAIDAEACKRGFPPSCNELAELAREQGNVSDADLWYTRACDLGDARACGKAARVRRNLHTPADTRTLLSLFVLACDANDAESCRGLAELYETGNGTAKDVRKAVAAYAKACASHDAVACAAAARLSHGDQAKRHPKKACQGDASSCAKR